MVTKSIVSSITCMVLHNYMLLTTSIIIPEDMIWTNCVWCSEV